MKEFDICIAGVNIHIESIFDSMYRQSGKYLIDRAPEPDISVCCEETELREMYNRTGEELDASFTLRNYEPLYIHEVVSEAMPDYDAFLIHGAAVSVDNAAYLFIAPSGTGKTTHIRLWRKNLEDCFVVNGDKPFIRFLDGTPFVCGTPWCGKERLSTNTMVPLKAIVCMERAEENKMTRISMGQALPVLLKQTYIPKDPAKLKKTMRLISMLNPHVSIWHFDFNNFKEDAFRVSCAALTEKQFSHPLTEKPI